MLSVVLIMVLAALALLVTALITGSSLWAWLSIGASLLAAVALFLDWLRRRARQRKAAATTGADETAETAAATTEDTAAETIDAAATGGTETGDASGEAESEPGPEVEPQPEAGADTEREPEPEPARERPAVSVDGLELPPGEEDTDAADLLVVSELDDEVLVIDEQPRYHLPECGWLADKDTIPITVSEARELGFTPCARCGPDASLVARAKKKQKRSLGKFGRD